MDLGGTDADQLQTWPLPAPAICWIRSSGTHKLTELAVLVPDAGNGWILAFRACNLLVRECSGTAKCEDLGSGGARKHHFSVSSCWKG